MSQGPNIVLEWLSKLHLAHYVESFIDNGYDDLEVCKQIGEPDLDAIGVRVDYHRHRLLAAVQKLRGEDSRKAPGYYFTLEPLQPPVCRGSRSQARGQHQPSCPGNHNPRVTACSHFVTYPKLKLKVLIRDKLAKDGIDLGGAPYTFTVSSLESVCRTPVGWLLQQDEILFVLFCSACRGFELSRMALLADRQPCGCPSRGRP